MPLQRLERIISTILMAFKAETARLPWLLASFWKKINTVPLISLLGPPYRKSSSSSCAAKRRYASIFVLHLININIIFIIHILLLPTGYYLRYRFHILPAYLRYAGRTTHIGTSTTTSRWPIPLYFLSTHHCWLLRRSGANIGGERLTGSCAAKRRYATIFILHFFILCTS